MRSMTLLCNPMRKLVVVAIVATSNILAGPISAQDDATGQATDQKSQLAVLVPVLKETPAPDYDVPIPPLVSGQVLLRSRDETSGAEGVSVTDGYSVVKTNAQGNYTLKPSHDSVFVYITRPA